MSIFLTPEQQQSYRENGYFFPLRLFSPIEATEHRRRLEEIEAQYGPMHYRTKPYLLMTSANEIARLPELLDAVESLLGHDILLWDSAYVIKEPHNTKFVSWHQDLTYWGLDSDALVTAWVALSPATEGSGCMKMLTGSHCEGKKSHRDTYGKGNILHRGQELEMAIDEERVMSVELKPGEASLHHGWVAHASYPNLSDDRRIGLSLHYISPRVMQKHTDKESATLVRGEDRQKNFSPEPICNFDFAPEMVAFQAKMEKLKHEVYDTK